jgi:hypothetical protein
MLTYQITRALQAAAFPGFGIGVIGNWEQAQAGLVSRQRG